jgi:hypothetical protein
VRMFSSGATKKQGFQARERGPRPAVCCSTNTSSIHGPDAETLGPRDRRADGAATPR